MGGQFVVLLGGGYGAVGGDGGFDRIGDGHVPCEDVQKF